MVKKKHIYTGLLFLMGLVTLFLWKEHLSFSQKINSDKIGDFATSVASILTAITVFLLYKQINEMVVDRKAANQPDLYPNEIKFITKDIDYDNFLDLQKEKKIPEFYKIDPDEDFEYHSLNIMLSNIGLAVAKEIKLSWIFSTDEVNKMITGVYAKPEYTLTPVTVIDFIAAGTSVDVEIPYSYMVCCGKSLNQDMFDLIKNNSDKNTKPSLVLNLIFNDIYGNKHERSFTTRLSCYEENVSVKFFRTNNYS